MVNKRVQVIFRRTISLELIVLFLFATGATAQNTGPAPLTPTAYLGSPRVTVQTFFEAMSNHFGGDATALNRALDCLYLGEELTREQRLSKGLPAAEDLFEILDSLQFSLDTIPASPDGENVDITLGEGAGAVTLRLHLYDDGRWRFSSQNLEAEKLAALAEQVGATAAEPELEDGVYYHPDLGSPRETMRFFLTAMDSGDPEKRKEAIKALDLRGLDDMTPAVRQEEGMNLATSVKNVIDRYKYVEFNDLPPYREGKPHVFLQDAVGNIVIDLVSVPQEDGRTERSWRFTQKTLDAIPDLWDKYIDRPRVAGLEGIKEELTLTLRVKRFVLSLERPWLLNTIFYLENWQWLGLFSVILFGMVISRILGLVLVVIIRMLSRRSHVSVQKDLERNFVRPIRISLMAWFWLLGLALLGLPPNVFTYLRLAAVVVTLLGAVWAAYRLIDIIGHFLGERAKRTDNRFDDLLVPILTRTLKVFTLVIAIVVTASESDIDLTALLTGLGLGGLAFALAAKDVVANFFGSLTIILDRPFELGDWITVGEVDGSVEQVGIRSTRVRTFYNSLITVPNSEIINSSVDNMGKRRYRRIKTTLGLSYDTPPELMEAFCEGVRELIRRHPYTRKDYYHVYFNDYGPHSLDVLLYCFVETPDWSTELRERHRLMNDILRLAERLGVQFAFPTQTVYLRQDNAPAYGDQDSPASSRKRGREDAQAIVRELLGDSPVVPPPVTFGSPPDNMLVGGFDEDQESEDT